MRPNANMKNMDGMSLVEIIIAASIITVGILALINAYSLYVKYALTHDKEVQATYLIEEGLEAVTLLRDQSWVTNIAPLTASTNYSLYYNGTSWIKGTTTEYIDGTFVRNFIISDVLRDGSYRISSSTGTIDSNTRKVTVTVSYGQSTGTTTQSLSKYLINLYAN